MKGRQTTPRASHWSFSVLPFVYVNVYMSIHIYIYMYQCVCVCACECECVIVCHCLIYSVVVFHSLICPCTGLASTWSHLKTYQVGRPWSAPCLETYLFNDFNGWSIPTMAQVVWSPLLSLAGPDTASLLVARLSPVTWRALFLPWRVWKSLVSTLCPPKLPSFLRFP